MSTDRKPLKSGQLGIVRKDRVDQHFFVLFEDCLDFYAAAEDVKNNGERKGRLAIPDIEELGVLDNGFVLQLENGKILTVQCSDTDDLNSWLDKITSVMEVDDEPDENSGNKVNEARDAGNNEKIDRAAGKDKKEDRNIGKEQTQDRAGGKDNNAQDDDDDDVEEIEVRLDADFHLEVKGKQLPRYFWLLDDVFECYTNRDAAENAQAPLESFALSGIAQVDKTPSGFNVSCKDNRKMVIICDEPSSRSWIAELRKTTGAKKETPLQQVAPARSAQHATKETPDERGGKETMDEQDVEVILDAALQVVLKGQPTQKHVWLTSETFDYTETSEEGEDALESFTIDEISRVEKTPNGFNVCHKDGRQQIVIYSGASTSDEWIKKLQKLLDARRNKKSGAKQIEVKDATTEGSKKPAALSQSVQSSQRRDEAKTVTTPMWSKQTQGTIAASSPSRKAAPPGYPGAKFADEPGDPHPGNSYMGAKFEDEPEKKKLEQMSNSMSNTEVPICKGDLGIFQRGKEEKRYFVLFEDAFKYWIDQTSYDRSDDPRGHVLNEQIVAVSPTNTGFALSFEGSNQIVLICGSEKLKKLWIDEWRKILGSRASFTPEKNNITTPSEDNVGVLKTKGREEVQVPRSLATSVPQEDNDKREDNETRSVIVRSQPYPGGIVDTTKDLLCEGNLLLVRKLKKEKRYFALFKDRLDYFAAAADMKSGRHPRGRVWFRDIGSVKVEGCSFTVNLENVSLPNMVLVAEPDDSQSWLAAWRKGGVHCIGPSAPEPKSTGRSVSPSPARSHLQKSPPSPLQEPLINGAIIEGQFQMSRGKGGVPSTRHFVLFQDRLDCFSDATAARRGRALESFPTKDIQWIDVVDGGFEITVANRPYKLRELQGLLAQWIDALLRIFDERENDYLRR